MQDDTIRRRTGATCEGGIITARRLPFTSPRLDRVPAVHERDVDHLPLRHVHDGPGSGAIERPAGEVNAGRDVDSPSFSVIVK